MAQFKGTVFESTRLFSERQFGPDAVAQIMSGLSKSEQDTLASVSAVGWYPVEPILRYHYEMERIFGTGDFATAVRAGKFSVDWQMNTVLKVFLRFRSPEWLIEKATSLWTRFHDTGHWKVTHPKSNLLVGELSEFGVRDPIFCARLRGWLQGAVELTGGKNPILQETQCTSRGGTRCSFNISWS